MVLFRGFRGFRGQFRFVLCVFFGVIPFMCGIVGAVSARGSQSATALTLLHKGRAGGLLFLQQIKPDTRLLSRVISNSLQ